MIVAIMVGVLVGVVVNVLVGVEVGGAEGGAACAARELGVGSWELGDRRFAREGEAVSA